MHDLHACNGNLMAVYHQKSENMEAQLWKAIWKRKGQQYHLSLLDHPSVKIIGTTPEEMVDQFEELVAEKFHDAVPHFEFLNQPASDITADFIFTLTGHHEAEKITNLDELFGPEKCPQCKRIIGARTEALICLEEIPKGDLVFTDYLGEIISKQLASFLKIPNYPEFQTRPVIIFGKESSDFLELNATCTRSFVAIKGLKAGKCHPCFKCGSGPWMYMPNEAKYLEYISIESLPPKDILVFPIGVPPKLSIALDATLREEIIKSKKFKNLVSRKIGVLPKDKAAPISDFLKKSERSEKVGPKKVIKRKG